MIPMTFLAVEADEVLGKFASDLETESLEPSFRRLIDTLHEGFADNFASTKSPSGTWPPHAPYTIKKYGPHPLLILSGAMLQSVTVSGSSGSIEVYSPREMTVGTSLFYAGFQQFGTMRIPARRFLWIDSPFMDRLTNVFAETAFTILVGN